MIIPILVILVASAACVNYHYYGFAVFFFGIFAMGLLFHVAAVFASYLTVTEDEGPK